MFEVGLASYLIFNAIMNNYEPYSYSLGLSFCIPPILTSLELKGAELIKMFMTPKCFA
jgi:hypothetical protein